MVAGLRIEDVTVVQVSCRLSDDQREHLIEDDGGADFGQGCLRII